MKTFPHLSTLLLAIGVVSGASADTVVEGGLTFSLSGETAAVTECPKDIETVIIPSSLIYGGKEYSVTAIKNRAFFNCKVSRVDIPSTVTFIGEKAFYGCNQLTEVDLSSVAEIKENAFEKCLALTSATLSLSLTEIEEGVFYNCYSLLSMDIPESVKSIGKSAFFECHAMTSVTIPSSVESIGDFTFYACDALPTVTIPYSVKEIGGSAFWNCTALESVSLPESLEKINGGTFYGCKSLASVAVPNSVTSIGARAFEQCHALNTVILPSSLVDIEEDAFKNCESIVAMVSYPAVPPAVGNNAFYMVPSGAVVYVAPEALEAYPVADGWTAFNDFRPLGSVELTLSASLLDLKVNDSMTLTVSVDKAPDVEILSESWYTSDPEVAVVDGGVVTAVGEGSCTISYILIDGTGCPFVSTCDVYVKGVSVVDSITGESNDGPAEYYNLNGVRVDGENLMRGIYIKRQGNRSVRILVK